MQPDPVIIISRTDSIGDVVLTLPMAGLLKEKFPLAKIYFLGRSYTQPVIELCAHVDGFINYDDLEKAGTAQRVETLKNFNADIFFHVFPRRELASLAKKAGIPVRVGTTNRWYHWLYCNRLVPLSRKRSNLHEAQLNLKLMEFLKISQPSLAEISRYYGFTKLPALDPQFAALMDKNRRNIILHPKSKGSAVEWGLDNFRKLITLLPQQRFKIFISGTAADSSQMQELIKDNPMVTDITGKMTLRQFIAFIAHCDALVAASTGPLHIAAALGKKAVGVFSPRRPIHPGRWKPLGPGAHALVAAPDCSQCGGGRECNCISRINPQQIVDLLEND
jgi:ADP-heptose:LPS heptosyltransferase